MPSPDQPSVEVRLPERPPELRDLALGVQEVRRLLQAGSIAGPLLENHESRPSREEGKPREKVPKTEQPSMREVEQRALEMEHRLFRSIVEGTNVSLRTAMELADSRAAMQRMQAWAEVQLEETVSGAVAREQSLLMLAVELDRRRTLIQYQEALIHDFLNVVERYVAYAQSPAGAEARMALLREDPSHVEKEKKVAAMLEELTQIMPLLSRLAQVRFYEAMLEEDGIATAVGTANTVELAKELDALTLPEKTGAVSTGDLRLTELARRYMENQELQALFRKLPPALQNQSLRKLRVILRNPQDYRTLERQINSPGVARSIAAGGTLREGLHGHVETLRRTIARDSRSFAFHVPDLAPEGANEMEQSALDLLNRGVPADASGEDLRDYADVLEKRMRDMFRVGVPWKMADDREGERESRVANSLYLGTVLKRREQLFQGLFERKEGELPNLERLAELHDLYMQEIAETIAYHKEELRLAGDLLSLLYTQRHIGPGTRITEIPLFIERLNARERAALERTIGAPLMQELQDEGRVYGEGLDEYISAIEKACDRHSTFWKNCKEQVVLGLDEWSRTLEQILVDFHGWAWFIPDRTGFSRKWSYGGFARLVVKKLAGEGWTIDSDQLRQLIGEWKGEITSMKHTIEQFEESSEMERAAVRMDTRLLRQLHMGVPSSELALTERVLNPIEIGAVVTSGQYSFIPEDVREEYEQAKERYDAALQRMRRGAENRNQLATALGRLQGVSERVISLYFENFYQVILQSSGIPEGRKQDYRNARNALLRAGKDPEKVKEATGILRQAETALMETYVRSVITEYTKARRAVERAKGTDQEEQTQQDLHYWEQTAATVYLRILEDLQVYDLPGLTGAVDMLMNSLGEKVGKHAERFRQLQIMESAAWSTGIGTITTITEPFVLYGGMRAWGLLFRGRTGAPARWGARMMERAGKAALPKRMSLGRASGTALLAYRAYLDWGELQGLKKSTAELRREMIEEITDPGVGFVADPPDQSETFTYRDGGTEITVNIRELDEAQQEKVSAQRLRTAVSAAEVASVLRFGASRSFWPLVAVEVAVEVHRYGVDQQSDLRFINRAPAWLLAKINLQKATGETAYDLLAKFSGEVLTDAPLDDAEDSAGNVRKRDLREKMLFAILHRELGEFPGLLQEVYNGNEHPRFMDAFYGKEFKELFLPTFYARLYEHARGRLSWEEVRQGQIDADWNQPFWPPIATPNVTLVEIRVAMRETIVFFIQHRLEEQYLAAVMERRRLLEAMPDTRRAQVRLSELNDLIAQMEEVEVFGKKLREVDVDDLLRNGGRTRAELISAYLHEHAGDGIFGVPAAAIPGLPQGFSFGKRGDIYKMYLKNPAMWQSLDDVLPETIEESEGSVDADWVHRYARPILGTKPFGITEEEIDRKKSMHAVAEVYRLVGARMQLPENISTARVRQELTVAAMQLAATRRTERTRYRQVGSSADGILFFGSTEGGTVAMSIGPLAAKEEYGKHLQIAQFVETFKLKDGGNIMLGTFIFGDPTNIEKLYVVQKANVRADMVQVEAYERFMSSTSLYNELASGGRSPYQMVYGHPYVMTAKDFLAHQSGGRRMLNTALDAYRKRQEKEDERIRQLYVRLKEENREKTAEVHEEARKDPGAWKKLPYSEDYRYVAYSERHGFMYLDMWESDRIDAPALVNPPNPDRLRVRRGNPPVEIRLQSGGHHFLRYDYRLDFRRRGIDLGPYEDALTYPLPSSRSSLQKILTVYVGLYSKVCEEAEEALLPLYSKMKTKEQQQLFLRTFNDLIQRQVRRRGRNDWGRIFERAHNELVPEMKKRTEEAPSVFVHDGEVWRAEYSADGKIYEVSIRLNSRSKSGGRMYYPNKETDSVLVTFREKQEGAEAQRWTVWGYTFFRNERFPREVRDFLFDVLTLPYDYGIPWHNMDRVFTRFPHDISANSRIAEACEQMFRSSTDQQAFLRGLFEVIEENGARVTGDTAPGIIRGMRMRYERGDFDVTKE